MKQKQTEAYVKEFLKRNWWLLWIVLGIATAVNFYSYITFSSMKDAILAEIDKSNKSVVMLSPTGTIIQQKRVFVDSTNEAFKNAIKNILVSHMVISGSEATFGFTKIPRNAKDLVYSYAPFKEFYTEYLTGQAKTDFANYVRAILKLLNEDNYPDFIDILRIGISDYMINKDGFKITINVDVMMMYDLPEQNKRGVKARGTITIYAEGDFQPKNGSTNNPLGVKFTKIKATLLKKRNDI